MRVFNKSAFIVKALFLCKGHVQASLIYSYKYEANSIVTFLTLFFNLQIML